MAGDRPVEEVLDLAEKGIFEIAEDRADGGFTPIGRLADQNLETLEARQGQQGELTGVPTGFEQLDRMTAGLQPSDLIIIAARPAMGKTSFCLNMAEHMAINENRVVAFFSLEMSKEQLGMRVLTSQSRVSGQALRTGFLNDDHWGRLVKARQRIADAPLHIDDSAGASVLDLRAKARRLKMELGRLDCVVVDYLQLMNERGRHENRNIEISTISRGLKALAKELHVPMVTLSQLSRAPERRMGDHRPQLADLRESGAIEQDADVVGFIFREEVYDPQPENEGRAEIIIGKQRNGPIGTFPLVFFHDITRFENMDPSAWPG